MTSVDRFGFQGAEDAFHGHVIPKEGRGVTPGPPTRRHQFRSIEGWTPSSAAIRPPKKPARGPAAALQQHHRFLLELVGEGPPCVARHRPPLRSRGSLTEVSTVIWSRVSPPLSGWQRVLPPSL
jgi:hypothetical protein